MQRVSFDRLNLLKIFLRTDVDQQRDACDAITNLDFFFYLKHHPISIETKSIVSPKRQLRVNKKVQ